MMKIGRALAAAAIPLAFAVASCSNTAQHTPSPTRASASTDSWAQGQADQAVPSAVPYHNNPVTILRLAGCIIPAGTTIGQPALFNDAPSYHASCAWGPNMNGGSQTLQVWAYDSNTDRNTDMSSVHRQDGQTVIIGDRFIAELSDACCGETNKVTSTEVANRIGGVIS